MAKEKLAKAPGEEVKKDNRIHIVTRKGDIVDGQVDEKGNIIGWNRTVHAHATRDIERAKRLAAARKGQVTA